MIDNQDSVMMNKKQKVNIWLKLILVFSP